MRCRNSGSPLDEAGDECDDGVEEGSADDASVRARAAGRAGANLTGAL
jgi:hypothetical protein